jgi:hypothetical protein
MLAPSSMILTGIHAASGAELFGRFRLTMSLGRASRRSLNPPLCGSRLIREILAILLSQLFDCGYQSSVSGQSTQDRLAAAAEAMTKHETNPVIESFGPAFPR